MNVSDQSDTVEEFSDLSDELVWFREIHLVKVVAIWLRMMMIVIVYAVVLGRLSSHLLQERIALG